MYFTLFKGRMPFISDKGDLAFAYQQYSRITEHWRSALPADCFLEVDYEKLVADREAVTRRLIDFCGLDWHDSCLQPERNERPVTTASLWQARQPAFYHFCSALAALRAMARRIAVAASGSWEARDARWPYQIGITVLQENAGCGIETSIARRWAWKCEDEDCRINRVRDRPLCVPGDGLYPSRQSRSTYPVSRGFRARRPSEIDRRKRALCRPVAASTAGAAAAGLGCNPDQLGRDTEDAGADGAFDGEAGGGGRHLPRSLQEYSRQRTPVRWAAIQNGLGLTLWRLGEREDGTARLKEAALQKRTRDHARIHWAITKCALGFPLARIAEREGEIRLLRETATAYDSAYLS
jgi:hypothetical protein